MRHLGECIQVNEETIEAFDRKWQLEVEIYHKESTKYNLVATIEEKHPGLFDSPDIWEERAYNIREYDLNDEINTLTEKMLEKADNRIEARNLTIDINIDHST